MPKPNKQHIIDAIIKEIEQGKERGYVIAKFCNKFQKSARTIDTYWKKANQQYAVRQEKASKAADAVYIQMKEDAAKEAVMSKEERLEYLTKIIRGEIRVKIPFLVGGKIMEYQAEPSVNDRKGAIAELNKMGGDYAPTKVANTDVEGNNIVPFTDSQVDKLINSLRDKTQAT